MDPLSLLRQQKTAQAKQAPSPPENSKLDDPADVSAALGRPRERISALAEFTSTINRYPSGPSVDSLSSKPTLNLPTASLVQPLQSLFNSTTSLFAPSSPTAAAQPQAYDRAVYGLASPTSASPSSGGAAPFEDLLQGEKVMITVKKCFLLVPNPLCEVQGRLLVTNYRIKFQVPKGTLREELKWMQKAKYFDVPMGTIEDIKEERSTTVTGAIEQKLKVTTKDFRVLSILLATPDPSEAALESRRVLEAVGAFSTPGNVTLLFAFKHAEELWATRKSAEEPNGWHIYDPVQEYARMGIETEIIPNPASPWQVSNINAEYGLCATYPAMLALPRRMSDQELRAVAAFRKRGRLPAMSWCGGPELNFASIWRCSQTTEGLMGQKSPEDQTMVQHIRNGARKNDRDLLVIDLRPWKSAWANKAGGGGFEGYSGCKLVFGGIDNIHAVRDAWTKMGNAVNAVTEGEVGSWMKDVANSCWYDYIGAIIHSSVRVIKEVLERSNVMVHCSDGWDRTAQCTSLAMLCLDPNYRTQVGFLRLIQKEFCSFGHRFRTRCALGEAPTTEYSPVFIQWLDCVFQMSQQFPTAFEWTPAILLRLASEVFTNRYGTFLCDSEKERAQKVTPDTVSLWSVLLQPDEAATWKNPRYQPDRSPLVPSVCQANFVVWEAFWFRYHPRGQRLRPGVAVEDGLVAFAVEVAAPAAAAAAAAPPAAPAVTEAATVLSADIGQLSGDISPGKLEDPVDAAKRKPAPSQVFKEDDEDEDVFAKPRRQLPAELPLIPGRD